MTKKKIMNMKQKYSVLVIFFLLLMLTGCQMNKDNYFTEDGNFKVRCINSRQRDRNSQLENKDYFYKSADGVVYQYKLDTQEKKILYTTENSAKTCKFAIPYLIYIYESSNYTYRINRVNLELKEEECLYETSRYVYPSLDIIDNDIYIQINDDEELITYRCPVDGDVATQLQQIDTTSHFSSNISTDNEQYTHLAGRNIVVKKDERTRVNMYFSYQVEGEQEKFIDCFNKKGYANSRLVKGYLTAENENEIKGIMSVSGNRRESVLLNQGDIVRDMLFELNIDTGESQILYDTKNNQTRIVGYEDGILYLFKNNYKVYKQPLSGGEATEILSIPKSNDVIFDWCEDYLIVRYRDTNNLTGNQYPTYDVQAVKVK